MAHRVVVWPAIAFLFLTIAWLLTGRRLAAGLDRVITVRAAALPVARLEYDGGGFLIGGLSMTFGTFSNLNDLVELRSDSSNRVVLSANHSAFTMGPRTNPVDPSGRPEIFFAPEPGDELSFMGSQSALGWPTPFAFKILGGASPWWKRYVYYRLVWRKPSGAKLEMRWRYERHYYSGKGWSVPRMLWNYHTGLVAVDIQPESKGPEGAVVRYIAKTKAWTRGEYAIERRGSSPDGRHEVFAVVHLADQGAAAPGGGKSVELYVDSRSHEVTRELGGQ